MGHFFIAGLAWPMLAIVREGTMRQAFNSLTVRSLQGRNLLARTNKVPEYNASALKAWRRHGVRFPLAAAPFLFIFGAISLFGRDIDLVQQQKQEAARRRACLASKLAVNDANMGTLSVPGAKYHFTRLVVEPPIPSVEGRPYASEWSDRQARREQAESRIAEAEANVERWQQQLRTIETDCAPYAIPGREEYIRSKSEELERWIDGERYFIHLARERLEGL
jgi:hypothetical protein